MRACVLTACCALAVDGLTDSLNEWNQPHTLFLLDAMAPCAFPVRVKVCTRVCIHQSLAHFHDMCFNQIVIVRSKRVKKVEITREMLGPKDMKLCVCACAPARLDLVVCLLCVDSESFFNVRARQPEGRGVACQQHGCCFYPTIKTHLLACLSWCNSFEKMQRNRTKMKNLQTELGRIRSKGRYGCVVV